MSISNAIMGVGLAAIATSVGVASSIADDQAISTAIKAVMSLGTAGVLAWLVWYLIAKYIPRLEQQHEARMDKQAEMFQKAIDKLVSDHGNERNALREDRSGAIAAIRENTDATNKLATAVEHMRGTRHA
jgi:phosphate/sulfate permease